MTLAGLLAICFTLGWVAVFFCRTEELSDAWPELRRDERLSSYFSIAALSTNMALGCAMVNYLPVALFDACLALIVHAAGIGLWFWGRSQISPWSMRRRPDQPPLRLRRDGAFGLVRHPLYCGMLIAAAAPLVATRSPLLALVYVSCVIAIVSRMLQEERRLLAQVGAEYEEYSRQVSRLIPFIW